RIAKDHRAAIEDEPHFERPKEQRRGQRSAASRGPAFALARPDLSETTVRIPDPSGFRILEFSLRPRRGAMQALWTHPETPGREPSHHRRECFPPTSGVRYARLGVQAAKSTRAGALSPFDLYAWLSDSPIGDWPKPLQNALRELHDLAGRNGDRITYR